MIVGRGGGGVAKYSFAQISCGNPSGLCKIFFPATCI